MERLADEVGGNAIAGSRFRYNGFLADRVVAGPGRADCCGRAGILAHVCSMCAIATCDDCVRRPSGPVHARAWRAGVTSPLCNCLLDDEGNVRWSLRGSECMLDDGSGRLRPVFYVWPS